MVRILSGGAFALIALALMYAGSVGTYVLAAGLAALALWEFRGLSGQMGYLAPTWLLYPLGVYFTFSGTLLKNIDLKLVLSLALVGGLMAFLFIPGRREGLGRWAMGMAGALYVGLPFNFYLVLYQSSAKHGLAWLVFTVGAAVLSDVAALLVGSRLGRHAFFSRISPKKTVEGAVAGVVAAVLTILFGSAVALSLPWPHAVALGILIGLSAELGDLVESQMKRIAEVKDSSHLIPGHGGVLDRLDSALFPPILVYYYALLTGLLFR
ncbi:MAG: hypothetical protein E6J02_11555 [Chloroflexi bacterium]|nr:MAG: hypothetical protein E6J02_11555 [Chloroflexota bacterium]TME15735.1 MAG: hypothetical protein E6I63_08770 [Chloroflexota bacterium]